MAESFITLVINDIVGSVQTPLVRAITKVAAQKGVNLIILEGRTVGSTQYADPQHNNIYQMLNNARSTNTVIASNVLFEGMESDQVIESFLNKYQHQGNIVSIGAPLENFPSINIDLSSGVVTVLEHLTKEHNCQKPLFVVRKGSSIEANKKYFEDIWVELHHSIEHFQCIELEDVLCQGGALVEAVDQAGFTYDALVFSDDLLGSAYLEMLQNYWAQRVGEYPIVACGNRHLGSSPHRFLTTVSSPSSSQIVEDIFELLEEQDEYEGAAHTSLLPGLHIGGSCGCHQTEVFEDLKEGVDPIEIPIAYRVLESLQSFNKVEFFELLANSLGSLNVNECFVALFYDCPGIFNDAPYPELCELVFCYHEGKHVRYDKPPVFDTKKILPDDIIEGGGPHSLLLKPLFFQTQQYGYVVMDMEKSSEFDLQFLHGHICHGLKGAILAEQYANAVEQVHTLNARLQKISVTDELTGLFNRRGFNQAAEQYLEEDGFSEAFVLFFADVDGLKKINDQFGHSEGDFAIKAVANTLNQTFGEHDLIARASGDEFVAISKDTRKHDIPEILSKMSFYLKEMNHSSNKPYSINFSCGYYYVEENIPSPDLFQLLKKADKNLYKSKESRPHTISIGGVVNHGSYMQQ